MAFGDFTVVRSTVKNVLNSSGVLAEVAINTPAFEFNADGSYKGLLVEPAATNLALYSQELDNAYWTKNGSTISANSNVAPDGTTTMDSVIEDTSTGLHGFSRLFAITSGTVYTYSFFAKIGDRSRIFVNDNTGALPFNTVFDLSTGTVVSGTNARITDVGGGIYRCETTATATGTLNELLFILMINTGVNTSYTGNGTSSIVFWGVQLETGSVATSYIPTVASTVARTADDISLASASSVIGQTEGTMYIELLWRSSGAVSQNILYIGDGTANNSIALFRSQSANELRMFINSNGINQTGQGQSSVGYSGIIKIAFAYATNDAVLFKDGVSISSDNTIDLSALATISNVYLGQSEAKALVANMWIRSVALFPTRLANATLASLTTL